MKFILLSRIIFILSIIGFSNFDIHNITLKSDDSYYYEEKYFRILSNNYDSIDPGNFWNKIYKNKEEKESQYLGIGFEAKKDFGSLILLKDWSMYNFKLTKIIFRKVCLFKPEAGNCDAEMLLYHTKDNGYYPPGRRIFMKQNFFIIVVPFRETNNDNPAIDLLFKFLNLEKFSENTANKVTPLKPVKLYQIIQNQPSYLFEGKFEDKDTLFMVFTQYHFISTDDYIYLETILRDINTNITIKHGNVNDNDDEIDYDPKTYRNIKNSEKLKPKVSLMVYSKANYLNNILLFFIIFLI